MQRRRNEDEASEERGRRESEVKENKGSDEDGERRWSEGGDSVE